MAITNAVSSIVPALPNAVVENIIFSNLSLPELGTCSRVCKVWKEMAKKQISAFCHEKAFGPKEWFIYFGSNLRNVPRLPANITEVMNSACPFWLGKKVHETHLLVLVPETVGGQPLTLKTVGELVTKPVQGNATNYYSLEIHLYTDRRAPFSRWVLMTRDVIEGSRNKNFKEQQALLEKHIVYEVPYILDATVCIFMEYVRSGTRLYSNSPYTFTSCQEKYDADWQWVVGGFGPGGLGVVSGGYDSEGDGVGGCRKL
jgi:hypothetical protein